MWAAECRTTIVGNMLRRRQLATQGGRAALIGAPPPVDVFCARVSVLRLPPLRHSVSRFGRVLGRIAEPLAAAELAPFDPWLVPITRPTVRADVPRSSRLDLEVPSRAARPEQPLGPREAARRASRRSDTAFTINSLTDDVLARS